MTTKLALAALAASMIALAPICASAQTASQSQAKAVQENVRLKQKSEQIEKAEKAKAKRAEAAKEKAPKKMQ